MPGQLFTEYFLGEGIRETAEWRGPVGGPGGLEGFKKSLSGRMDQLARFSDPNESLTEQDLVRPVFDLLGWTDYLPQQGINRNEDIPDHLLFADGEAKERAGVRNNPQERYADALVVQESKRFGLPLDMRDQGDKVQRSTPHGQLLRYLSTTETVSDGRIRWGILTNGAVWRLYDHRARPRATGYFEVDLRKILEEGNDAALRTFLLLFRRESFLRQGGVATTFLEDAIAEGRRYEQQVAQDLSGVVFQSVFPDLVNALAAESGANLAEVRDAALVFLYRLLFLLYAEDRGLLPVNDPRYDDYGLRKPVRDEVAARMARGDTFSAAATNYYNHLTTLFRLIDQGDPSIGLPPYNGGLFAPAAAQVLESVRLPDTVVAKVIHDLSHTSKNLGGGTSRRFVNYRDMSVQQLGSIYERLLEREPVRNRDGTVTIRPNPYARKDTGSFYTPQELVDLIVEKTLGPLVDERLGAFEEKSKQLSSDRRSLKERQRILTAMDPAAAVLDLKVLDPAMGSGHFLVTAVDFLSDYIADLTEYAPAVPEWLDGEYVSPLARSIDTIRNEILTRAQESNWVLNETQLTDQAIIRRMVLKRCIYGVDKNPLTVELAKVSLWLHSFTVGAPLSFLDHHLRCGDSLLGLRVIEGRESLQRLGGLFAAGAIQAAENATNQMQEIEEMSDSDISEVRESSMLFESVEQTTAGLRGVLDFFCGVRWVEAGMSKKETAAYETELNGLLGEDSANVFALLSQGPANLAAGQTVESGGGMERLDMMWQEAMFIARKERFLHWEVAFPGVWRGWQDHQPQGGFDAVIGNPPWDRIKLQEVEWFATRSPELALAPTAAARRAAIKELRDTGDGLTAEFDTAKGQADTLGRLVRTSGHYPLLGGGDINLYSLFVERATKLLKPDGMMGLLTPSGIYADKTAANFFKSVTGSQRVAGIYDFENRKIFFKDVHASFKFCALIVGGGSRKFDETKCAFFLQDLQTINDPDRCFPLAAEDFSRVNPNTATAPIFRTRRDAEITLGIYERHPVLVDRSSGEERRAWPVRYVRMFDMTNDSHLFLTAAQLEGDGFYPVDGNRWRKGHEVYVPLYQGRVIHQFDHRANSIGVNFQSTHNPYLSQEVTLVEHTDPEFLPHTQYWVSDAAVESRLPGARGFNLAFRDIARPTDMRTVIATIVPNAGLGNTLPLLLGESALLSSPELQSSVKSIFGAISMACLVANMNAFVLDFVARQKAQGTHVNWYILEQLPVIANETYEQIFGNKTAREIVRDHVLRLTYTANDMIPFARDLGYDGPPFIWNEEERRHLRARLDALYFHLYGLSRDDAGYVMDTFPIVRREDEAAFGRYRTRELALAYMNALEAGDTETVIAL